MKRDALHLVSTVEELTRKIGSILVGRFNLLENQAISLSSEHRWSFMKHHHDLYLYEKSLWDNFLKVREEIPEMPRKALFDAFTRAAGIGIAIETGTLGHAETLRRIEAYKSALNILVEITGTPHQVGA